MTPLIWTRRAIDDIQSIRQFIAQDSPHYAELVTQRLIASVERLPALPQSGRVVPEINDPTVREVIQGSYRIVYRLIREEIHIVQSITPHGSSVWSHDPTAPAPPEAQYSTNRQAPSGQSTPHSPKIQPY